MTSTARVPSSLFRWDTDPDTAALIAKVQQKAAQDEEYTLAASAAARATAELGAKPSFSSSPRGVEAPVTKFSKLQKRNALGHYPPYYTPPWKHLWPGGYKPSEEIKMHNLARIPSSSDLPSTSIRLAKALPAHYAIYRPQRSGSTTSRASGGSEAPPPPYPPSRSGSLRTLQKSDDVPRPPEYSGRPGSGSSLSRQLSCAASHKSGRRQSEYLNKPLPLSPTPAEQEGDREREAQGRLEDVSLHEEAVESRARITMWPDWREL